MKPGSVIANKSEGTTMTKDPGGMRWAKSSAFLKGSLGNSVMWTILTLEIALVKGI